MSNEDTKSPATPEVPKPKKKPRKPGITEAQIALHVNQGMTRAKAIAIHKNERR